MSATLDILFVADVRFEGGTSTALAVEIRAAARAGLRTGLLAIKGPLLGLPFPMHPDLRKLIDDGLTERIDPDMRLAARLTLIHHPTIVENRPTRPLSITTDKLLIVLHHPMYDGAGRRQYDLDRVVAHACDAFGADVHLAPVSAVVRDSLPRLLPSYAHMLEEDWGNLIELDDWPAKPARPPAYPVVIGRHSRPDPLKWPSVEDALLAYPADGSRFRVRALGTDTFLAEKYGTLPTNWELIPFAWDGVPDFLATLDFYVYFHDPAWSEAFGRTILEALATGLVVILPPHFAVLFAKAAVYAEPAEVERVIERFVADPALHRSQCEQARRFVENNHDAAIYGDRVARVMGEEPISTTSNGLFPPLPQRNVLFASSNGIGVGHLTQQLAIAQRLPPDLTPVFATMSYSMKAAVQHGYQAHFLPHHRILEADPEDWNTCLAEELFELIAHLRPAVFAYDATAVFEGVTRTLAMFPDIFKIWVRRPLWQESHRVFLEFSDSFDAVIEPGELAETFDHGPTAAFRKEVFLVPPVLHLDPAERMSRESARAALGVPEGMTVVAFQLGAGANFDLKDLRAALLAEVLRHPDTIALEIQSPITPNAAGLEILGERHRTVELFPSFRFSRAFDAAISAAGYNTFHEQVLGCIPTLFVPNEGDEMDLQANRARWAELTGRGWMMRRDYDLGFAASHVERLLDPVERAAVVRRCQSIVWTNGAVEIARYVEDHARMLRTDWDVTKLGSI
ncbi:MAG TPA: glycosyltransferase [Mesorhizobium sp.]|jgi:UDP:flavonoid glycosyltransferase YjiC (YdhE family)|nr:glycosyltransferase [Mesorhizobium sp.]